MDKYEALKLENQICFPLYACAREVINKYRPFLDEIGLTYTQYVAMMVFWEKGKSGAKELGEKLHLDSGTLTPVLKSLEKKGLIKRVRDENDERLLFASITEKGEKLKERAADVPAKVSACLKMDKNDAINLYRILYKILSAVND